MMPSFHNISQLKVVLLLRDKEHRGGGVRAQHLPQSAQYAVKMQCSRLRGSPSPSHR